MWPRGHNPVEAMFIGIMSRKGHINQYPGQADNFDEVTIVGKSGIMLLSLIQDLSEDHYSVRDPPG